MLIRPDSGLMFYKNTDQDCEDRKKFKMFTDPTLIKIHNFANYHKICNTVIYIKKKILVAPCRTCWQRFSSPSPSEF